MAESIFAFNYKLNPSYYAETLLHTAKFISQKRPLPPFPTSFPASQTIFLISQVQCLSGSWVINEIPPCPQPPAHSLSRSSLSASANLHGNHPCLFLARSFSVWFFHPRLLVFQLLIFPQLIFVHYLIALQKYQSSLSLPFFTQINH